MEGGVGLSFGHDALQLVAGDGDGHVEARASPRHPDASIGDEVVEVLLEVLAVVTAEVRWIEVDQRPVDAVRRGHVTPDLAGGWCGRSVPGGRDGRLRRRTPAGRAR